MDSNSHFASLSDQARLWIYPVDKSLSHEEKSAIESQLEEFIQGWHSHGRKVNAEAFILHNRFILIAAEIPESEISGCGIDASVHAIEAIGKESGFSVLSGLAVMYRDSSGSVQVSSRSAFRKLVKSNEIKGNTIVFDPGITLLSQYRAGAFELPAHASWHAMVFRIPAESV